MKHQHQTNKMRAATAHNPCRQRRNQPLAVRCLPALASISCRFGLHHQVLNDDVLEPLMARARRGGDRKRFRAVDGKLGDPGAASPLRSLAFLGPPAPVYPSPSPSRRASAADAAANAPAVRTRPSAPGCRAEAAPRHGSASRSPPADASLRQPTGEPSRSARTASSLQANRWRQDSSPA